jgi:hypothetical protein
MKGVSEGEFAALCTSHPEVQAWLSGAVETICRAAPDLGGFFTITASENLSNCWSHHRGRDCVRCGKRSPGTVIAEVNALIHRGIARAGAKARLIAWDWGWADGWVPEIIEHLPPEAALMSVSEWSIPIRRGGIETTVGEYSISTIGPGPRAQRHWDLARQRGLKTLAKIQAGNTWELSAVPYIPALENVATHIARLSDANVDGLMLGWTLGGYPSPNLEVVMEVALAREQRPTGPSTAAQRDSLPERVGKAMHTVAQRRFGTVMAPAVVEAWRQFSAAFSEFPYHGSVVYNAPMQTGPSNLLWAKATGYRATMVGFPYDDLDGWRGPYPVEILIAQFETVAGGFERAAAALRQRFEQAKPNLAAPYLEHLADELNVAEAAAIHFRSTANQARFVQLRQKLGAAGQDEAGRVERIDALEKLLRSEIDLARRLCAIQNGDSRIGFEATNQYYYVPLDLVEKILNCRDLLGRWLPGLRSR